MMMATDFHFKSPTLIGFYRQKPSFQLRKRGSKSKEKVTKKPCVTDGTSPNNTLVGKTLDEKNTFSSNMFKAFLNKYEMKAWNVLKKENPLR